MWGFVLRLYNCVYCQKIKIYNMLILIKVGFPDVFLHSFFTFSEIVRVKFFGKFSFINLVSVFFVKFCLWSKLKSRPNLSTKYCKTWPIIRTPILHYLRHWLHYSSRRSVECEYKFNVAKYISGRYVAYSWSLFINTSNEYLIYLFI